MSKAVVISEVNDELVDEEILNKISNDEEGVEQPEGKDKTETEKPAPKEDAKEDKNDEDKEL